MHRPFELRITSLYLVFCGEEMIPAIIGCKINATRHPTILFAHANFCLAQGYLRAVKCIDFANSAFAGRILEGLYRDFHRINTLQYSYQSKYDCSIT